MNPRFTTFAAVFIVAAFFSAPTALAQNADEDDVRIRAKRVTIEVDDEGRVLIDGKHVSDERGDVLLRVEPENGDVEVEVVEPMRRRTMVRRAPGDGHNRIYFRRGGEGAHPYIDDFDFDVDFELPHIPDVAPMLERFRVDLGDPLRESLEEHREVAELERKSRELAREARRAQGAERSALESDLREQLEEIFAKKLELREHRIADLEVKVGEERDKLQRRRTARSEMIERRLRTLMGEDDILDW